MDGTLQTKIICHHIGARGYGVSFNSPSHFQDDTVFVLYDADADAITELENQKSGPQAAKLGETHIFP